jgi:hypothetical protein
VQARVNSKRFLADSGLFAESANDATSGCAGGSARFLFLGSRYGRKMLRGEPLGNSVNGKADAWPNVWTRRPEAGGGGVL